MSRIGDLAVHLAVVEMRAGACEIGGNNQGPWVEKYLNAEHPQRITHQGEPWCAAFFSWAWLEAARGYAEAMPVPYTRSTGQLLDSLQALGQFLPRDADASAVQPGDAVFWDHDGDGKPDHVNMVFEIRDGGLLFTIGGNEGTEASGSPVKISRRGPILAAAHLLGFGLMCPGGTP